MHDFPGGAGRRRWSRGTTACVGHRLLGPGLRGQLRPVLVQAGPVRRDRRRPRHPWVSSRAGEPDEQWLRREFDAARGRSTTVTVLPVVDDDQVVPIRTLEVGAGPQVRGSTSTRREPRPSSGSTAARSTPSRSGSSRRRPRPPQAHGSGSARSRSTTSSRTGPSSCPARSRAARRSRSARRPERRACFVTLDVPDCSVARIRAAEEKTGLDRTFTSRSDQQVGADRTGRRPRAPPRRPGCSSPLGGGLQVGATSIYGFDPKVSSRFAYDGQSTTAWVVRRRDRYPTLLLRWGEAAGRSPGITVPAGSRAPRCRPRPSCGPASAWRRCRSPATSRGSTRPLRTRELEISFVRPPGTRARRGAGDAARRDRDRPAARSRRPRPAPSAASAPTLRVDGRGGPDQGDRHDGGRRQRESAALEACDSATGRHGAAPEGRATG